LKNAWDRKNSVSKSSYL